MTNEEASGQNRDRVPSGSSDLDPGARREPDHTTSPHERYPGWTEPRICANPDCSKPVSGGDKRRRYCEDCRRVAKGFVARVYVPEGKYYHYVGYYQTKEEADAARLQAKKKLTEQGVYKRTWNSWPEILEHGAEIVRSYSGEVTLRQLYYRLISDGTITGTASNYSNLASNSADARRKGTFPSLVDRTRSIAIARSWQSREEAYAWVKERYCRDRTDGQEYQIIVAVEKSALVGLLDEWYRDYGVPIVALRGYSS
jgi:hypothetical protein